MAGLLFVVTIPIESEEGKLKCNSKKSQTDTTGNGNASSNGEKQTLAEYGTFKNSPASLGAEQKAVSIDICVTPKMTHSYELLNPTAEENLNSDQSPNGKVARNPTEVNRMKKSWDGLKEIVSSGKKSGQRKTDEPVENRFLDIPVDSSMEKILQAMLKKLRIDTAVWQLTQNALYHQISFTLEPDYRYEMVLNIFTAWGIGEREGSCVSVLPCTIYSKPSRFPSNLDNEKDPTLAQNQSAWDRFMQSIRARLNVAQIVQEVKTDAALTFDFLVLIFCAGSLASFGLFENSTILLVSSMLISPLMGPIIAMTFGIVIKDRSLVRFGLANEIVGILAATSIGFMFGLIIGSIEDRFVLGSSGVTREMVSRCEFRSLVIGILTALPSGAAVAIAILGANIGSLVGVAISASLLPPAVNAGVLWSLACLCWINQDDEALYSNIINTNFYSDNQAIELAVHGLLSLLLTAANIVCIVVMGVLILKVKEISPMNGKTQQQFWKHDIKVARDYNQTNHVEEDEFTQKLADEITEFQQAKDIGVELLRNIGRSSYQNTWSPSSSRQTIFRHREYRPSIADLQKICAHLTNNNSPTQMRRRKHSVSFGESWSPPRYSSFEEHIHSGGKRRASMPFIASFGVPPTNGKRVNRLENISEVNHSLNKEETTPMNPAPRDDKPIASAAHDKDKPKAKRTIRKFIVTPAADP